mgnify:CR=1 FL=1
MGRFTQQKTVVRSYFAALESAAPQHTADVISRYLTDTHQWWGVYPFRDLKGKDEVAGQFWVPLKNSLTAMQRREDIFIAGYNELSSSDEQEVWVMSMGHFMGLFDREWLGIRPTGKMVSLRYAEFSCVEGEKITKTGLFVDVIGLMQQAGCYPLPPSTGVYFTYPGPRNHDGLLLADAPEEEGEITRELVNRMVQDLSDLNDSGAMGCPPEVLEHSWSKNMIWYGPAGIGATYTIPRYQRQHQLPFRENLTDKKFHGHECRLAEGRFAAFFGWPNLSNSPLGGFLGLPGGAKHAEMQVVDVYCREDDKLSENWVLIDIPYWLKQQGLDLLARTGQILNPKQ